jgi:hypothetical protein
VKLLLLLV